MLELLSLMISRITDLTLESARMSLHMWETIRVWIRFLSLVELKAEDEGDDFGEKTWRGCKALRWNGLNIFVRVVCVILGADTVFLWSALGTMAHMLAVYMGIPNPFGLQLCPLTFCLFKEVPFTFLENSSMLLGDN